jgi:Tfp pilus assembly protein PilV
MTKPLTLVAMLLLTVIALGVVYLAYNQVSANRAERNREITACVQANIMTSSPTTRHCVGR